MTRKCILLYYFSLQYKGIQFLVHPHWLYAANKMKHRMRKGRRIVLSMTYSTRSGAPAVNHGITWPTNKNKIYVGALSKCGKFQIYPKQNRFCYFILLFVFPLFLGVWEKTVVVQNRIDLKVTQIAILDFSPFAPKIVIAQTFDSDNYGKRNIGKMNNIFVNYTYLYLYLWYHIWAKPF